MHSYGPCKPYDYIIKPYEPGLIVRKIELAFEQYLLINKIALVKKAETEYYQEAVRIFNWKKELMDSRFDCMDLRGEMDC